MRKPPPILALMSRRATLLHGAFQYEPGRPRGFDHATRTNCARSSSVIRSSDLTAIATSVARREPWRDLRASSITLHVAFCSGTSPPRLLSAFCGQTPSANSFLNWNGRPARAPEAALSIVALPKGRIHEMCPALVAPATAEYGTLNSEVIAFFFCRVVAMSKSAQRNDV